MKYLVDSAIVPAAVIVATAIGLAVIAMAQTADQPPATRLAADAHEDPIVASFERELNHKPMDTPPIRGESIDEDVLYKTMNAIHWTPDHEPLRDAPETKR